jgi:hypothetical protein
VKGPALEAYVYDGIGYRVFKDIDFSTRRKDVGLVDAVLRGLGFDQGRLDEAADTVVPASREEIAIFSSWRRVVDPNRRQPSSAIRARPVRTTLIPGIALAWLKLNFRRFRCLLGR